MRFALTVIGSRGDVQPFVALGAGLAARNHEVRLCAPAAFEDMAKEADLEFRAIPGDAEAFFQIPEVIESLRKSPSILRMSRAMPQPTAEELAQMMTQVRAATDGVDLVVNSLFTRSVLLAQPDQPWCSTSWWPITPTRYFQAMGAPEWPIGGTYNWLTHRVSNLAEWLTARPAINAYRRMQKLPEFNTKSRLSIIGHEIPMVYPYSPSLLPKPPDWPANAHVTGYWFWQRPYTPPVELVSYLADGPAPLAMTFGSTWAVHRPEQTLEWAIAAARAVNRRLVIFGGPAEGLPDDVLRVENVDYAWLFPQAAAVIHGGGAAGIAEVLRAGVPHVLVPTFADQPFWSALMAARGVAPKPIPFSKLNGQNLAAAVAAAVGNPTMHERAAALGAKVRAERGVDSACDLLERFATAR